MAKTSKLVHQRPWDFSSPFVKPEDAEIDPNDKAAIKAAKRAKAEEKTKAEEKDSGTSGGTEAPKDAEKQPETPPEADGDKGQADTEETKDSK